ncbi:MAG: crotonase/enoyl-CoA hydratase family protein [Rhizobacter sp.]|nr:crotonase/enoyl-CoA hydratase family protein [Rhizobacter sp.]
MDNDNPDLLYRVDARNPRVARITLNRPARYNAIGMHTPALLRQAVEHANDDDAIHVIVLDGAGEAFCSGYDLKDFAEQPGANPGYQERMPWDPMLDYRFMKRCTDDFMSLWRSHKPTIARVHKYAVAGGSDIALCCDFILMDDDARIGYPPARVWGCPTTAMWVYRVGAERAKRLLLTGDLIDGRTALDWGLATGAVPLAQLDDAVARLADRMSGVPRNQLMMHKMMINQAIDAMGLQHTQMMATLFDGITRHSPEGVWFKELAAREGFRAAVQWRDSGRDMPQGDAARDAAEQLRKSR